MSTLTVETSELRKQGFAQRFFFRMVSWIREEYRLTSEARIRWKAENGHAKAQYVLGARCDAGKGGFQLVAEAVKWYQKAAFQGVAKAQLALGLKYLTGQGVAQNDTEALLWLRKAAEQGEIEAQYQLGNLYPDGRGATRDLLQASKWYRRAAERGHAAAKNSFKELTSANFEAQAVEPPANEQNLVA